MLRAWLFCLLLPVAAWAQDPYIVVLGTAQDAGYPHIGCEKTCCERARKVGGEMVNCLGLVDPVTSQRYLFEATPDMPQQLYLLDSMQKGRNVADGIFLTHAHIGHYTGLMHLGREALGAKEVKVLAMPRMGEFLSTNGPWSQLVSLKNIALTTLTNKKGVTINKRLSVVPFTVPHRDEFSETVGYRIIGPNKTAIFIPDIDKWEKWDTDINQMLKHVDIAFLDGSFYNNEELPNRDMSEIPHPFIVESRKLLKKNADKVVFIHFNHTNQLLDPESEGSKATEADGFRIARTMQIYGL